MSIYSQSKDGQFTKQNAAEYLAALQSGRLCPNCEDCLLIKFGRVWLCKECKISFKTLPKLLTADVRIVAE